MQKHWLGSLPYKWDPDEKWCHSIALLVIWQCFFHIPIDLKWEYNRSSKIIASCNAEEENKVIYERF